MSAPLLSESLASLTQSALTLAHAQSRDGSFEGKLGNALRVTTNSVSSEDRLSADNLQTDAAVFNAGIDNASLTFSSYAEAARAASALQDVLANVSALADAASNGAVAGDLRSALDQEAEALGTEYDRILDAASYHQRTLVDGATTSLGVQGGYYRADLAAVDLRQNLDSLDLSTSSAAQTSETLAGTIYEQVAAGAATLSAGTARLASSAVQLAAQADYSQSSAEAATSDSEVTRFRALSKAFGAYALSRSVLDDTAPNPQDAFSLLGKLPSG